MSMDLSPAFSERNVAVFSASDEAFALYCGVMLHSVISHASPEWNYDLIVLEDGVSQDNQQRIIRLGEGKPNVSIRFFNMSSLLRGRHFPLAEGYTVATWFRIFAPFIFQRYEKIVYLDADVVVLDDVAKLYHESIGDCWLAGCTDVGVCGDVECTDSHEYYRDYLGVNDLRDYVNGGVLVFHIALMNQHGVGEQCLQEALLRNFRHQDQDTLNYVCRGHICMLDSVWNAFPARGFERYLSPELHRFWTEKKASPKIVHFIGMKPWVDPLSDMAFYWWEQAHATPFYEEVAHRNLLALMRNMVNYARNYRRYWGYRLLSHLTFGALHERFKARKRLLRRMLKRTRSLLDEA